MRFTEDLSFEIYEDTDQSKNNGFTIFNDKKVVQKSEYVGLNSKDSWWVMDVYSLK